MLLSHILRWNPQGATIFAYSIQAQSTCYNQHNQPLIIANCQQGGDLLPDAKQDQHSCIFYWGELKVYGTFFQSISVF